MVSFVKLFTSLLDSSTWALPDSQRVIWITLLGMANSRGRVHASICGIANRARKSIPEVQEALQVFLSPDPYSRSKEHEGRRLLEIDGGWQLVTYEKHHRALTLENVRESKRAYAARRRANLNDPSTKVELVEKESKLCSSSSLSGSDLDLDPDLRDQVAPAARVLPAVLHELPDDWQLSAGLRDEAVAAGVHPDDIDRRVAELRTGTIGGQRGVLAHKLDEYIRRQFGKWKTWGEVDRAKAQRAAADGPRTRFDGGGAGQGATPPKDARKRVPGLPEWVWEEHAQLAAKSGVDLKRAVVAYARRESYSPVTTFEPRPTDVREPFRKFLQDIASRGAAHAGQ